MANGVQINGITHRYGDAAVLSNVSLAIEEGEFVTFLGPSGCGKTTLLRIIAGFISPTAGSIVLQGRDITALPPHRRPLNMVFQRPTLFPHLDARENVAFGLRLAGVSKSECAQRVAEALELVRLPDIGKRRAGELSGGQIQRVTLARALVNRPSVLLLDEPLSALDLKIRLEMEVELRRVHRETGATFIYVTHDQREALALSDRIAVFSHGQVEQLAPPSVVYAEPATPFAARFVGDANVLACSVEGGRGGVTVGLGATRFETRSATDVTGPAWLVVRPEAVRIDCGDAAPALRGVVRDVAYRGTGATYRIDVGGLADGLKAEIPLDAGPVKEVGTEVTVSWGVDSSWLLPRTDDEAPPQNPSLDHAQEETAA